MNVRVRTKAPNSGIPNLLSRRRRMVAKPTAATGVGRVGRARLFKHLIRTQEHRLWDREAQRLRGLEVDPQLELRWLLHGKVGRLGSFEDLVHVGSRASL